MDLTYIDKTKRDYDVQLRLLAFLGVFDFKKELVEEAQGKLTMRFAGSIFSSFQDTRHYPLAPAPNTWIDKLLVVGGIILASVLIGGIWKCLLLLCAC